MYSFELLLLMPIIGQIVFYLFLLILVGLIISLLKTFNNRQIKKVDKNYYYRDIPCFNDINVAYWLLYKFSDYDKNILGNDLIGAYLLKWHLNNNVEINVVNKNNYTVDLKDGSWDMNPVEKELYNFLKEVSGNNNLLEKNEIKNYCSLDGNSFKLKWIFKKILDETTLELERKKLISVVPSKNYILFKTQEKITLSSTLLDEYTNLMGLKNFLLNYSSMNEKEHIEVKLWDSYLIFANILDIADKVKDQFKKIYPDLASNRIFEVSFDNTISGYFNTFYKQLKIRFISILLVTIIVLASILFEKNIMVPIVFIVLFASIAYSLYWNYHKHYINKKVKEMNSIAIAKIIDVTIDYDTEYDHETGRDITTKTYYFTYEYNVNGMNYKGYSHSGFKKRKNQKIKIYYNEMKPEKNETAAKHNKYLKTFMISKKINYYLI